MSVADDIRSLCIPQDLPGGRFFLEPVCRALSLVLIEYEAAILRDWSKGGELALGELFDTHPALVVMPTFPPIEEHMLDFAVGRVQAWASVSTGTDHVDLARLAEAGMPFFHAPGANAASVAEYVISALPRLFRDFKLMGGDVSCGIIGYGRIGSRLGKYLHAVGIPFRFYDPFVDGGHTLEQTLASDLITFHVPLTRSGEHATFEMVDEAYLSKIPQGAALINTARGRIFSPSSYQAACRRLRCIMDVFPGEPPDAQLLQEPVLVSPHVAGYAYTARAGGARTMAMAFAEHHGLDPDIVPEIPTMDYEHFMINFLVEESRLLKENAETFGSRRAHFPPLGDLAASLTEYQKGTRMVSGAFQRRILERIPALGSHTQ